MPPKYLDGSFRQRGERIEYRFYLNGKQLSCFGKNKSDCWNQRTAILKNEKKRKQSPFVTYADWAAEWLKTYKKPKLRASSYADLEIKLRIHILPKLGKVHLKKLNALELQQFINGIERSNTRRKVAMILSGSLRKAFELGILKQNPLLGFEMPVHRSRNIQPLQFEEQTRILNACTPKYRDVFFFLCCTGLRLGEFCALDFEKDIDLDRKLIKVSRNENARTKEQGETKSRAGIRNVPFLEELLPVIRSLKEQRPQRAAIDTYFDRLRQKLDLPHFCQHSCRHTFISVCGYAGINGKQVQIWAGHSTYEITMNTYTHLLNRGDSEIIQYIKKLGEIF